MKTRMMYVMIAVAMLTGCVSGPKVDNAPVAEPALLRVSFFGPFYVDYRVMKIDAAYTYALVGSGGAEYL